MPEKITVLTGSDWAGDRQSHKSINDISHNGPSAQVLGLCEGLAVASLCRECGCYMVLEDLCDSLVAKENASIVWVGKLDLQVKQLWSQGLVRNGRASVT